MTETDIKHLIQIELSKRGCKCFDRPTGLFVPYRNPVTINGKKYVEFAGTPIKINTNGHSDLQGHRPDGICFYLECKKPDHKTNKKRLEEQQNFIDQMIKSGAKAGFCSSVEQALEIVGLA